MAGGQDTLSRFLTPDDLFLYLTNTHPPQRPGTLPEEDYWAVTAKGAELGSYGFILLMLGLLVGAITLIYFRRRRTQKSFEHS